MKKIFLTAALVAMAMSSFAQVVSSEEEGYQTTSANLGGYLGYDNAQLIKLIEAALDIAFDDDADSGKIRTVAFMLDRTDKSDREEVLEVYELCLEFFPTYLEKAEQEVFFSGSAGKF